MRGRIVFVNPQTLTGLIFGTDSKRYNFQLKEWGESRPPARNLDVNFHTQGLEALAIKPFSVDYSEESPVANESQTAVKKPRRGTAGKSPELTNTLDASFDPPEIDPLFNDGITLPAGVEDEKIPLTAKRGWGGPKKLDSRVLLEEGGPARPAWHYYLIGVGGALVLLLVAFLIRLVLG